MKSIITTSLVLIFTIICINFGYSQSINTAGNSNQLTNHQISWTIGELYTGASDKMVSGNISESISIYEEEANVTANKNLNDFQLSVFPNPTHDQVNINFNENINIAELQLINSSGSILMTIQKNEFSNTIQIPLDKLENGIYFISISNKKHNTKTYKILKR
jgi:hypothetical protein